MMGQVNRPIGVEKLGTRTFGGQEAQRVTIVEITERVLTYRKDQLEAWGKGDKSIAPPLFVIHQIYWNQPR